MAKTHHEILRHRARVREVEKKLSSLQRFKGTEGIDELLKPELVRRKKALSDAERQYGN